MTATKLEHSVKELIGVIEEYKAMPCKSLEQAMYATANRHKLRLADAKQGNNEWTPVDGAENLPVGTWKVVTAERNNREREIHIAKVVVNRDRHKRITVGNYFHFDMPKVCAYAPAGSLPDFD